jgi:nucleoside-diphosphate-sugar epimerase
VCWLAVGEEDEVSIKDAAEAICKAMGFTGELKVRALHWARFRHQRASLTSLVCVVYIV